MSGSGNTPRPGSAEAFRQRREAYRLIRDLPGVVDLTHDRLVIEAQHDAKDHLERHLRQIEQNPVAARMAEISHGKAMAEAKELLAHAQEESRMTPRVVERGEWRPEYGLETRLDIGRSEQGWHYRVLVNRQNWENDPAWSKALPTRDAALRAGQAVEDREHGFGRHLDHPTTPRGRHAEMLDHAAGQRKTAERAADGHIGFARRDASITRAKELVLEARSARERSHDHRWGHGAGLRLGPKL